MKLKTIIPSYIFLASIVSHRPYGPGHLQQVLEKIGLEKADLDTIAGLPDTATDFKVDDYTTKVNSAYENKLLNSPEFLGKLTIDKLPDAIKKTVEAGQYGRFMNEFKALAQKKGIDVADLSEDDLKSLNKFGEKVFAKYEGKLGSPEAVTKLQTELQKALADYTTLSNEVPTKLSDLEKTVSSKFTAQMNRLITSVELSKIPGIQIDPSIISDSILNKLAAKYTLINDGDSISIMQKANPQLKAIDTAGKEITFADALLGEAKGVKGLIGEVKKDDASGSGKTTVEILGDAVKLPSNILDKINKNIALEGK